jgi:hypothetical protein
MGYEGGEDGPILRAVGYFVSYPFESLLKLPFSNTNGETDPS